jgi:hypothetical protein
MDTDAVRSGTVIIREEACMRRNRLFRRRFWTVVILALLAAPGVGLAQEDPPPCPDPLPAPYVFLLLDTSASMNWSPPCTQAQYGAGDCSFLCPTGDCFVPLQGDDPASKLYQVKEGLQTVLSGQTGVQLGFASFNQDALRVRAKHWFYQAQVGGPTIPGWGPYPAAGAQEVFGLNWGCDTGNNDHETGCYYVKPADLSDAWELTRVQRVPKAGSGFNQNVTLYLRYVVPPSAGTTYKVTYTPAAGSTPGAATVNVSVRIERCSSVSCLNGPLIGQSTVTWTRVSEFISWDSASSFNYHTNPGMSFFSSAAADANASNLCSGWDPNTDSASDLFSGYNLRWPTDASDSRGTFFTIGDVIPLDWNTDHNLDIQQRLAPNLALNPAAVPDFGIASYLQDLPLPGQSYLRLKDESARSLIAIGSTPIDYSLLAFRTWYAGWLNIAAANDPDWLCRKKVLVLLVDGDETCSGDPCATATALWEQDGVQTYVMGFGMSPFDGQRIQCTAANGGTGSPYYPHTKTELIDTLNAIFTAAKNP